MYPGGFDDADDLAGFVKAMTDHLIELGFDEAATQLNDWARTSFTTSSEFLGELGAVCNRVMERDGARLPPCLTEVLL